MALTIKARESSGITILDLNGKIVLGEESSSLREKIKELLAANKKNIVLNLGGITFIDSSGVGTLIAAYTSTKAQEGELKLASLTEKFHELLQVTRLLTVFEVHGSEADAVASFQ